MKYLPRWSHPTPCIRLSEMREEFHAVTARAVEERACLRARVAQRLRSARKRAYDRGHREGLAAARAAEFATIERLERDARRDREALYSESVHLCVDLVRAVVHRHDELRTAALVEEISCALEVIRNPSSISVAREDSLAVREAFGTLTVTETNDQPGHARIHAPHGEARVSVRSRIEALGRTLYQELARHSTLPTRIERAAT
jgi:flagellar biosynthesis/type III secretory pathway protein FliH